jgi:recombinational DNA repair protein (RecF pathway)
MLIELFSNPLKATLAFFMADVIKQCLQTDQADEQLFEFLSASVQSLDSAEDLSTFSTEFLIGFSQQLGIEPQIQEQNRSFFRISIVAVN